MNVDYRLLTNGVEYRVGRLDFTITPASLNAAATTDAQTSIDWAKGIGTFPNPQVHTIDGSPTLLSNNAAYTASGVGNGVAFITAAAVPEPSTFILGAFGLVGGWYFRRRRNHRADVNSSY
ncbi:MAG: PEP-CTERM sorting domain-containing protein [Pirellulales bacterium]